MNIISMRTSADKNVELRREAKINTRVAKKHLRYNSTKLKSIVKSFITTTSIMDFAFKKAKEYRIALI